MYKALHAPSAREGVRWLNLCASVKQNFTREARESNGSAGFTLAKPSRIVGVDFEDAAFRLGVVQNPHMMRGFACTVNCELEDEPASTTVIVI